MSVPKKQGKVVVIGAGFVGATIAYTIMLRQIASEIVLIDVNADKAYGEALDINHGIAFHKQVFIHDGTYEDCRDANIIIITAGLARKPGQTRIELAQSNVKIVRSITKSIMEYAENPVILVIANPVDILTQVVAKESGLPAGRVFGSGTTLDTGRFRYLLSRHCKVDVRNVHGYIIGEHGDSQVAVWSSANIAGKPFDAFCNDLPGGCGEDDRSRIFADTRDAGAIIIQKKGATYYGVAMAVSRIVSAVMEDEHSVLTVTSPLTGQYGIKDVALSLPCIVGENGVEGYVYLELTEQESKALENSASRLREVLGQVQ